MTAVESEVDELLGKIGHPLLEVRSRSLRSIVFKLNNGLISYLDLVNEKEFLVHLLEWFNYDEWVLESQVLSLIEQLAQHELAAKILVNIGGVEFLSQLRQNCNPSLHPLIDGTLEHLLTIPSRSASVTSSELLPSSFNTEFTSDMGSYHPQHTIENSMDIPHPCVDPSHPDFHPVSNWSSKLFFEKTLTNEIHSQTNARDGSSSLSSWTHPNIGNRKDMLRILTPTQHSEKGAHFPYEETCVALFSSQLGGELTGPLEMTTEDTTEGCLFPWLRLSVKDLHVLATTQSRLQSSSDDILLRSCHFVHDVLFEDFPADIFLQRPAIVKTLIQLPGRGITAGNIALLSLVKLTRKLKVRTKQTEQFTNVTDKITLSVKENIKNTTRSELNFLPNQSHDRLEELTTEMLEQLQSEQFSVDQFCSTIISSVAQLLPGYINKHLSWTAKNQDELTVGGDVAADVAASIQLIAAAMELKETKNKSQHPLSDDENTLLYKSIESVCSALSQCLSKWRRLVATRNEGVSSLLRIVCCITVHLAHCLSQLIKDPSLSYKPVPSWISCLSLPKVIQELMMSGVIGTTIPCLQQSLLPLFEVLDSSAAKLYCKAKEMASSFHKMASFLKISDDSEVFVKTTEAIELALDSLQGLWFTCNADFVRKAISLSFNILTKSGTESVDWTKAKLLLVSLLSHGNRQTMEIAYSHFVRTLLGALSTSDDEKTNSSLSSLRQVIFNDDILCQVCCYGAVSKLDVVAQLSRQLLIRILSLWKEPFWSKQRSLLLQWMPYIEVSASEDKELFKTLQYMHSCDEGQQIPNPTRTQSYLRLLFSQCVELQVWSFTQLTNIIISQVQGQSDHHFPIPVHSSNSLHDILATAVSTNGQSVLSKHPSFQLEDVLKLRHILKSTTMDLSLKKAALEQAALLLQDQSLHEQLMEEGFSEDLLNLLQPLIDPRTTSSAPDDDIFCIAAPCIKCLYLIASGCDQLRQELSTNSDFLLGLFKVGLLNHKDKNLLHCLSKFIISLVFVTLVRSDGAELKLPSAVVDRVKLPFQVKTYDSVSDDSVYLLECSLLTSDPLLSMLRVHYHVALTGSVSELLVANDSGCLQSVDDEWLCMPAHDIKSLKCLQQSMSLNELTPFTSHEDVIKTIHLANVTVLSSQVVTNSHIDISCWRNSLEKFLAVQPRTTKDVELLTSVLQFITNLLVVNMSTVSTTKDREQLVWLVEVTCLEDAACAKLLQSFLSDKQSSTPQGTLLKTLAQYYATITDMVFGCVEKLLLKNFRLVYFCETLCHCLNVTGSPDFYDLAVLEEALKSIVNLTSSYHFQTLIGHNSTLLLNLMVSLRQVLCSFTSGRGITTTSFIGKGVILRAAQSLSHVVQCSCTLSLPQGWWFKWMSNSPDNSLTWLSSLINDRDTKVQCCGFNLIALLCGKHEAVKMIVSYWSSLDPFGLWGVCLQTALSPTECVLVRQQAFFVLINLTTACSNERKWNDLLSFSSDELSVTSGRALELLLETHKLFSFLLSDVKTRCLIQLKLKLSSANSNSTAVKCAEQKSSSVNYTQLDNDKDTQNLDGNGIVPTPSNRLLESVEDIVAAFVYCCNPYVVSGWCRLVNNLLQAFPELVGAYLQKYCVVASLTSILEPLLVKQFFQQDIQKSPHCTWWVKMYADIINLLKTVVLLKPDNCLSLISEKETVFALCHVLSVLVGHEHATGDLSLDHDSFCLCSSVLSLLQLMVHTVTPAARQLVFSAILLNWPSFVDLTVYSFKLDPYLQSLLNWDVRKCALRLLNSLLIYCFQPVSRHSFCDLKSLPHENIAPETLASDMSRLLDDADAVDHKMMDGRVNPPSGSLLCGILLKAFEVGGSKLLKEWWLVCNAFGLLLASSMSAKQTALKGGLLEVLVEELKSLHTKLCMNSLDDPHRLSRGLKESLTIDKLVAVVNLLRNFLFKSLDIKLACVKIGLIVLVQQMWPRCAVNRRMLGSVLKMLCVLTAKHPTGRVSLATCTGGSSNSLLQSIVKTATHTLTSHSSCTSSKLSSPHAEVLLDVFSLLSNCTLSQECRAVFRKTGFLSAFTTINPKSEKPLSVCDANATKHSSVKLSTLWIKLLVNLSFSSDGQQMIIKQPDSIDVLLDVYGSNCEARPHCLLVLRNLCFHGPSKTLLASNENYINVLCCALDCWPNNKLHVAIAASAVQALLHNCAKIRCSLKKRGLYDKLAVVQSALQSEHNGLLESDLEQKRTSFSIVQALNSVLLYN